MLNLLSFSGRHRDVGFDGRLAEVDVENVCVIEICVKRRVHGDDVNELLELSANEEAIHVKFFDDFAFSEGWLPLSEGITIIMFFVRAILT